VSALPALWRQDRIARLSALAPEDARAGLLWLAMNYPDTCDAMLDKIECDAIDDPDPSREPEPFCAECGADIGIFLRYGLDWRHFRGDGTIIGAQLSRDGKPAGHRVTSAATPEPCPKVVTAPARAAA